MTPPPEVVVCDLHGPDADLLAAMAVVATVTAEQQGGLPPRRAERELAVRRLVDAGEETQLLVAGDRADPDGVATLTFELGSNAHVAHIDVWVPEDRRRRGTGSGLLSAAEQWARVAGRTVGMAEVDSPAPSGRAFFEAKGYVSAYRAVVNRILLEAVDRSLLASWAEDPDPAYELVLLDGAVPDDLVPPLLQAMGGMSDAPHEDLDLDPRVATAEGIKGLEAVAGAAGHRRWTYLAVHVPSGEGAGFTSVRWDPEEPTVVWQRGTAAAPRHRGHGLGRRLKAAMLLHLLANAGGAREVRTDNAGTNAHMRAINDALGFAPWAEKVAMQKRL